MNVLDEPRHGQPSVKILPSLKLLAVNQLEDRTRSHIVFTILRITTKY